MSEYPPHLDDVITFQLRASKVVVNKTVKISVNIAALSGDASDEAVLRADIKTALANFIPDAEWHTTGLRRETDESGYERVNLVAHARVDERENYNLETRAKKVSKTGLQLISVEADATVPQNDLEEAERELRATLLANALDECSALSKVAGITYRIKSLNYQNNGDPVMRKAAMVASTSNVTSYGSGLGGSGPGEDGDDGLSNAQKVTLSAQVQLGHASLIYT